MQNSIIVLAACFFGWIMILLPSVMYLRRTWRARRDRLFGILDARSIKLYFKQFYPSFRIPTRDNHQSDVPDTEQHEGSDEGWESPPMSPPETAGAGRREPSDEKVVQYFREYFGSRYGRGTYIVPLIFLALISALGLWATAMSILSWLGITSHLSWLGITSQTKPFPPIAISAFLGAYAWVLYDQMRRFRARDFTAHDVYSGVYRFLIAIPLGISLAAFIKDNVGIPFVFLLAAFPTQTLFKFSRRIASQKLGLGESDEEGQMELEQLQSIGRSNAERYQDEGITTIAELAWADPIDLTIRTNREFSFVVDSISQALLWVYLESQVKKLYPLSLRGAQEVCTFLDDLASDVDKVKAAAEKTLATAAELVGMNEESFLYTLLVVRDDPYSQFLLSIWE